MKSYKNDWLFIVIIIAIVIAVNYCIYQSVPDDKKWLFWLLSK